MIYFFNTAKVMWEVGFNDLTDNQWIKVHSFRTEIEAVRFLHFLNGGEFNQGSIDELELLINNSQK